MADFNQTHWALLDLQYEYLDDGYKLTATTDVPCHLFCRMTTTPPIKRVVPSPRRGIYLQGDVRFCFVLYEDNEQNEAGDTLTHTWLKTAWPICETRWFYFVGTQGGTPSVSETAIFKFHFPAPPPEPPAPILKVFFAQSNNRTIQSNSIYWPSCWAGSTLKVLTNYDDPNYLIMSGASYTVSYWIRRAFLTYDTTTIPATAKIVSAFLSAKPYYHRMTSSVAYPYWQITPGHQSDPVVTGDWYAQNADTAILGQIRYDALVNGVYAGIPLNAEGLVHIGKSLPTRYCLRAELDIKNKVPPLGGNQCWFWSYLKGVTDRPLLSVYYYPA